MHVFSMADASYSNKLYVLANLKLHIIFLSYRETYSVSCRLCKSRSSNPLRSLKFEAEADLNNIQKFCPYHGENTALHHFRGEIGGTCGRCHWVSTV